MGRRKLGLLGLDHGDWDVLPVQDEVGLLGFSTADQLAAHDDAALGEGHLPADLRGLVPPDLDDGRGDELDTDVVFAQVVLHS